MSFKRSFFIASDICSNLDIASNGWNERAYVLFLFPPCLIISFLSTNLSKTLVNWDKENSECKAWISLFERPSILPWDIDL